MLPEQAGTTSEGFLSILLVSLSYIKTVSLGLKSPKRAIAIVCFSSVNHMSDTRVAWT